MKSQNKLLRENQTKTKNKYKTELIKQQDKYSKVVANLKNRIKMFELGNDGPKTMPNKQVLTKLKS